MRSTALWAWDHSPWFAIALSFVVVTLGGLRVDKDVRNHLRIAVLDASAELSRSFAAYEATDSFTPWWVLRFSTSEIDKAARQWNRGPARLSIQALAVDGGLLYDSRQELIRPYDPSERIAGELPLRDRIWTFLGDEPFYVVDQPVAPKWKLRSVITGRNYLYAQFRHFLFVSSLWVLLLLVFLILPRYYRTVLTLRHFESVVDEVLNVSFEGRSEEDVLTVLPKIVRAALEFDFCAVYAVKNDHLALKATHPAALRDAEHQIRHYFELDSDFAEAVVARRNVMMVLNHPKGIKRAEAKNATSANDSKGDPYVIVPIVDRKKKTVIGVLSAWKEHGFEDSNSAELGMLVRLVMLSFDNARTADRLRDTIDRTVSQTRQVALGTAVSVVTHNLHGPMSMLTMRVRDLVEKPQDTVTTQRQLSIIEKQMAENTALINVLLEYQKIGVTPNAGTPTDLYQTLNTICDFFELHFENQEIRLVRNFDPNIRPRISLDERDVNQIVSNIFINADEAFSEAEMRGPQYEVVTSVTASPRGDDVIIRIANNGPPIPEELRERIFEPDFTTKGGTGVGLPYCRRVLKRAGGEIQLDTAVKTGVAFEIQLPMK